MRAVLVIVAVLLPALAAARSVDMPEGSAIAIVRAPETRDTVDHALGRVQTDDFAALGRPTLELVDDVEAGLAALARSPRLHRALIVIGEAPTPALAKRAAEAGIHVHALASAGLDELAIALDETFRTIRRDRARVHAPVTTTPTEPETEVPWSWLGAGALAFAGALRLASRRRSAIA